MLDIMNSSSEIAILNPKEAIGVLDLRSFGHYKIQQGVLQQNFSIFYNFESVKKVCNHFNNLINTLKKEQAIETGKNIHGQMTWMRENISDMEMLEKYIDSSNSFLHKDEKEEVMDILHKYKEAFSLRDEIGTCPNIEVEIDVTDKSPFLLDHIMLEKRISRL